MSGRSPRVESLERVPVAMGASGTLVHASYEVVTAFGLAAGRRVLLCGTLLTYLLTYLYPVPPCAMCT